MKQNQKHCFRKIGGGKLTLSKHTGRALLAALLLTGAFCVPVEAETNTDIIQDQQVIKNDWEVERPVYLQGSTINADNISLKDKIYPGSSTEWYNTKLINQYEGAPFVLDNKSGLNAKKEISLNQIHLGGTTNSGIVDLEGLFVAGGKVKTPTLEISHLDTTEDNEAQYLYGMNTTNVADEDSQKMYNPEFNVDTIYIHDIFSNQITLTAGAALAALNWKAMTEGADNNLLIGDIHNTNTADTSLAYGMVAAVLDDTPLTIKGKAELKNITSSNGSAVGMFTEQSETFKGSVCFHQLNISDIHGKDLSVGLMGGCADVCAENADINMTGKNNEYAGLYTASIDDGKKAKVNEFAIAGPYLGNVYLNNLDGNYTINGNILADQDNNILKKEAFYQPLIQDGKKQLEQPGLSEIDKKEIESQIQQFEDYLDGVKKAGHINMAGHLNLYGDVYAKNGGTLNIHLQNGSYFEGQADDYADFDSAGQLTPRKVNINADLNQSALGKFYIWQEQADDDYKSYGVPYLTAGTINLTMDPGSKWQTRGKSFITSLTFNHGGLVDTRKGHGVSVTIGKLTGEGGTFLMDFSKDAAKSDMLYVKDLSQSGVQHIQAYLQPDTKVGELKGIRFATTGGDDYKRDPAAKFDVSLYKNQGVNNVTLRVKNEKFNPEDTAVNEKFNGDKNGVGTYKPGNDYVTAVFSGKGFTKKVPNQEKIMTDALPEKLTTDDNGNLLPEYMKTVTIENPVKEGTNWFIDTAVLTPSDSGKIIKKSSQLDYTNAIYGIYTDNLNKRLGEARYSADGDGMWARIRHDRLGRESLYSARDTMTELGYDWKRNETSFGRHIQGAALDMMNGSANYKEVSGNSDTKRYGAWFYDTRLGNKGHYTDFIVKYGRLFNKYTLYPDGGDAVKANYHNNYYSMSFEYGRKKDLPSSWYVEPQAQLQYTYLGSVDYTNTQGSRIHLGGTDSLISRLGFRFGRDVGSRTTFYMNADFLHEFIGNQDIRAEDMTGIMDVTGHNKGSWYEAGFGVTTRLGRDTYMYADYDKSFGSGIEHTWSLEAGINFKF